MTCSKKTQKPLASMMNLTKINSNLELKGKKSHLKFNIYIVLKQYLSK